MKITPENTIELKSNEFIEKLSIDLWEEDNIYLINEPKKESIPDYFYVSAYIIQFDTEFQMQGLTTLLTNSTSYNFENTLNSFKLIGSTNLANCLQGILNTLNKYGMTPVKMRDRFLGGSEGLPEHSIVTTGQFFNEEDLLEDLELHEEELNKIYPQIATNLGGYLIKTRGN